MPSCMRGTAGTVPPRRLVVGVETSFTGGWSFSRESWLISESSLMNWKVLVRRDEEAVPREGVARDRLLGFPECDRSLVLLSSLPP